MLHIKLILLKQVRICFTHLKLRPSYSFCRPKFSSPVAENSDEIGTRPSSLKEFQVTPKNTAQFSRFLLRNNLSLSTSRQNQLTNICNTVSNLESDLISFKEEIQTKLDSMYNLLLLNEKLETAQLKHQIEISLLSRKVYDLQLENMNLKADLTKLLGSDKQQYRQMGKIKSSNNKLNAAKKWMKLYLQRSLHSKKEFRTLCLQILQ